MAQPHILDLNDYPQNAAIVKAVIAKAFPQAHIVTEAGYQNRVRVKVVGPDFNGLPEEEKQKAVWDILRAQLREGSQAISYVVVYGDDEL